MTPDQGSRGWVRRRPLREELAAQSGECECADKARPTKRQRRARRRRTRSAEQRRAQASASGHSEDSFRFRRNGSTWTRAMRCWAKRTADRHLADGQADELVRSDEKRLATAQQATGDRSGRAELDLADDLGAAARAERSGHGVGVFGCADLVDAQDAGAEQRFAEHRLLRQLLGGDRPPPDALRAPAAAGRSTGRLRRATRTRRRRSGPAAGSSDHKPAYATCLRCWISTRPTSATSSDAAVAGRPRYVTPGDRRHSARSSVRSDGSSHGPKTP